MLAAFGLLYACSEWGRLFIPIQQAYLPIEAIEALRLLRVLLLAASFGALLQFGIELLPARTGARLRAAPPILFAAWIGLTVGGGGALRDVHLTLDVAELQARVFLALPAGLVCALGLVFQERYLLPLGGKDLARWLHLTALAAGLTALTLGLMVPGVGAWPGTTSLLGVPAEVRRSLAGLLFALGLARTLAVFQLEQDRRLEAAEQDAIEARARAWLARELSDGVIQHLYAVGLLLGGAAAQAPADDPIHTALSELDTSIAALRTAIMDGEAAQAATGFPNSAADSLAERSLPVVGTGRATQPA